MKPVELAAKAVEHASRKDDMVLDLFLGSGTTMVAAHQLNRKLRHGTRPQILPSNHRPDA